MTRPATPTIRSILTVLLFSLVFVSLSADAWSAKRLGKAEHTIKVATLAPDGSTWMRVFREMNAELYEKSNATVKFKIYPGGVLGSEDDVLRKIRIGQVHGAALTGYGLTLIHEDFRVLNLPLMFKSYEEFDFVMERLRPHLDSAYLKEGYVVLGWPELGFTYCFSKKEVAGVSDLRKVKPWLWGDDGIMSAMYKSAKASPVNVDVGDVLTGLQTGLLDTAFNTPLGVIALQWFTRLETMSDLPLTFSLSGLVVDKKQFDRLPAETRILVKEITEKYIRRLSLATRNETKEALKVLAREGIRTVQITDKGLKEFEVMSKDVARILRGKKYSPEMYDLVTRYIEEYRKTQGGQ